MRMRIFIVTMVMLILTTRTDIFVTLRVDIQLYGVCIGACLFRYC